MFAFHIMTIIRRRNEDVIVNKNATAIPVERISRKRVGKTSTCRIQKEANRKCFHSSQHNIVKLHIDTNNTTLSVRLNEMYGEIKLFIMFI